MLSINPDMIVGFDMNESDRLKQLLDQFNLHQGKNADKNRYYEGNISLNSVNLGIALPDGLSRLEIGCSWGAKTVDVLAARSMFDGFVGINGSEVEALDNIVIGNNLIAEYAKACRDELKLGCTFATLSADPVIGAKIRFHSPMTASAMWNGVKGRIDCGFAIMDSVPDNENRTSWSPSFIAYYTDDALWEIKRDQDSEVWYAEKFPHKMGRPLMEPLIWNATSDKPFGRSRIKEPVRRLIDGYVRTIANATIGLEFATSPQKYLLGITDDQYDAVINQKFKQYVGSILASTNNPETGDKPAFGQLPQGNISPHVEMIRILATQFSAATGLSVTDTGVVSEANPTSAEAVVAQGQTLIAMAEQLNTGNGDSLRTIALMATAIANDVSLDELTEEQRDVVAHFKNPALPSVAASADAAIKIASARQGFAATDTFLEMIGFDKADIRRIKAQEAMQRGLTLLEEIGNAPEMVEPEAGVENEDNGESMG
ncbi:MAG: phage portal protein [Spirochaetia bacterium]|nr:phage portal protein [Spirochaetia bacterium]